VVDVRLGVGKQPEHPDENRGLELGGKQLEHQLEPQLRLASHLPCERIGNPPACTTIEAPRAAPDEVERRAGDSLAADEKRRQSMDDARRYAPG
jgi:hypothetical protein